MNPHPHRSVLNSSQHSLNSLNSTTFSTPFYLFNMAEPSKTSGQVCSRLPRVSRRVANALSTTRPWDRRRRWSAPLLRPRTRLSVARRSRPRGPLPARVSLDEKKRVRARFSDILQSSTPRARLSSRPPRLRATLRALATALRARRTRLSAPSLATMFSRPRGEF